MELSALEGGVLRGQRLRVPFARHATALVLHLDGGDGGCVVVVAPQMLKLGFLAVLQRNYF